MNRYDTYSKIFTSEDGTSYASGLPFMDFQYSGRIVYHKVTESEENRLDLIAFKYPTIADPTMWYAIALINSIKDPLDVPAGTELAIPIDVNTKANFIPFTYKQ